VFIVLAAATGRGDKPPKCFSEVGILPQ
jgi:hypothetical protein